MRILLSNDDGVLAPGLAALRAAVADMGELLVAAPDSPQSAAGHAITLTEPLTVQKIKLNSGDGFSAFSIDGRPADCVRLAVRNLMSQPPELVLSGINAGNNVGINVFYSGTVAAAAEAAMMGIPAVAFSTCAEGGVDFDQSAKLCRWVLEVLLKDGLAAGDLVNVNIPSLCLGPPKGIRVVPQSTAGIEDLYHRCDDDSPHEKYRLGVEYRFNHQENTDVASLAEGFITVTPLHVDMTNHDRLVGMEKIHWGKLPEKGR